MINETTLLGLLSIVLIDLVLSGDNAVVIGMAVRDLPRPMRRQAILVGTLGAIGLRVTFTILAALLLSVPYLRALGGVALFWIAAKLIRGDDEEAHVGSAASFWQAVTLIIVADFTLSLDNVLAVAGAANGHLGLLTFGLFLSIPILMLGSAAIAELLNRWPWLNYVGAVIIVWAGAQLIAHDPHVHAWLAWPLWAWFLVGLAVAWLFYLARSRRAARNVTS
ncbi:TerC family protein [Oceanithermus sp.]|uniref:TerC family protein n=1 Tax=Oceanithermus sp. TaxID=2268145 RepID=UPI0025E3D5E0|nr:TerC family protein [Oceanithermus sp.]